jgi:hypothetical protein
MIDNIKEKQNKFTITLNQIKYQIQQFDSKSLPSEKTAILNELKQLFTQLETSVK